MVKYSEKKRWCKPILNYLDNETNNAYTEGYYTKVKMNRTDFFVGFLFEFSHHGWGILNIVIRDTFPQAPQGEYFLSQPEIFCY